MIVGLEKLINVPDPGYWAVASPVFPCEDAEEWKPVMKAIGKAGKAYRQGVRKLNRRVNDCYENVSLFYGTAFLACFLLGNPIAIVGCQAIATANYYIGLDDCRDQWWLDYYDLEDELENAMDDIVYPAVE